MNSIQKEDFAYLLSIPSVNVSLEKRLKRDFRKTKRRRNRRKTTRKYKPVLLDGAEY
jgi:hypothetical protein